MSREYIVQENTLKSIADSIREVGKTTNRIKVKDMAQKIVDYSKNQNTLYEQLLGKVDEADGNNR
jgi:hypothetical protein